MVRQISALLLLCLAACDSDMYFDTAACRDGDANTACPVDGSRDGDDNAKPSYFASGVKNPELLRRIQETAEGTISFAGHFSTAYVSCGTGCGSYWFVDRRNGAVIPAPDEAADGQMAWEIETSHDSDVVEVTYGSRDGTSTGGCAKQSFRWTGAEFVEAKPKELRTCPS